MRNTTDGQRWKQQRAAGDPLDGLQVDGGLVGLRRRLGWRRGWGRFRGLVGLLGGRRLLGVAHVQLLLGVASGALLRRLLFPVLRLLHAFLFLQALAIRVFLLLFHVAGFPLLPIHVINTLKLDRYLKSIKFYRCNVRISNA